MAAQTKILTASDGLKIFTQEWQPPQYRAVICLIHGFGEHSSRYNHVAAFFNKNGYAVVAMDTRGHGKTEGKRGHAPNFDTYMTDIMLFINDVKSRYTHIPMFLYGHSMGGNLVLNYTIQRNPSIKGVIASAPWIQLAFQPKAITVKIAKLLRSIFPKLTQPTGLVKEHISKDPAVVEAYRNDPLVFAEMSTAAGASLLEAAAYLNAFAGKMPISTLIMHGDEDKLTSQPASEAFVKRIKGDVTYKKWGGMYHEIHNEPDKQQVFDYTLSWLNSKV